MKKKCRVKGCKNKAYKGLAYCLKHFEKWIKVATDINNELEFEE